MVEAPAAQYDYSFLSEARLAYELEFEPRTIRRAHKELVDGGWIRRVAEPDQKENRRNFRTYILNRPSWFVYHVEEEEPVEPPPEAPAQPDEDPGSSELFQRRDDE